MKLVRFDPLSLMRDFDRFFDSNAFGAALAENEGSEWLPRVDVSDREDGVMVRAEVPGVDPAEIDITLDGDMLTLKGAKSVATEDDTDGYRRREIFEGSFRRSVRLPFTADPASVTATASNGILEVFVPRAEEPAPHKISVDVV